MKGLLDNDLITLKKAFKNSKAHQNRYKYYRTLDLA